MTATKMPRPTEAQCQRTIIEAAKLAGWLVHAVRSAQTGGRHMTPIQGHAGFPDLVLVRGRECLIVELKRHPYKVQAEQTAWHDALRRAYISCGTVWVPEGVDRFVAYLSSRPGEPRPELEVSA